MLKRSARSVTPRAAGVLILLVALCAVAASTSLAAPGPPTPPSKIGGLVRPNSGGKGVCNPCGNGKLVNHGGPTMTTNKVYSIFWNPPGQFMDAGYVSTI